MDDVAETLKGFDGKVSTLEASILNFKQRAVQHVPAAGRGLEIKAFQIGAQDRAGIADFITKGIVISGAVDGEGAFLIPRLVSDEIERMVELQSPIRRVARVVEMPGRDVRFPVANAGMASGWIAEKSERVVTESPDFTSVLPSGGELYAAPQLTLAAAEDAVADLRLHFDGGCRRDGPERIARIHQRRWC